MGGKSTSQGAVLSGKKASQSSDFDLHSWQGLTKVLKKGKESLADPAAYAEFRNLVLEYAQQGGDVEIKKQIDSVIKTFKSNTPQNTPVTQKEDSVEEKKERPAQVSLEGKSKKRRRRRRKKNLTPPVTEPQVATNPQGATTTQTPPQNGRRERPAFKTPPIPEPVVPKSPVAPPQGLPTETPIVPKPTGEPSVVSKTVQPSTDEPLVAEVTKQEIPQKPESVVQDKEPKSTTEVTLKSDEEYKVRIAEIKRIVNEQIGNPATLIDDYNELGKRYMMALLGALKATGPGGKESSVEAMQKLEDAFQALQETPPAEDMPQVEETPEPTPQPTPEPGIKRPSVLDETTEQTTRPKQEQDLKPEPEQILETKPQPVPQPNPVPEMKQKPKPVPEKQQTTVVPGAVSKKIVTPSIQPSPRVTEGDVVTQKVSEVPKIESKTAPTPVPTSETEVAPKPKPVPEPEPEPTKTQNEAQKEKPEIKPPPEIKPRRRVDEKEIQKEIPAKEKRKLKLSPLSTLSSILASEDDLKEDLPEEKEKTERALHEIPSEKMAILAPKASRQEVQLNTKSPKPAETGYHPVDAVDPAEAIVRQSELSSPQIIEGLRQLLDEWSIFRSSGIFGTGPSGMEHPLYEQLSQLSMGEVMAGRWEGSNREVTKSIKEYTHAWRHEQGVAYNIQETFEHFLKRVILRIQKRQEENNS